MDGGNGIRRRMFPEWALGISASVFWVSSCIQRPTRLFAHWVPRGLLQLSAITHRHADSSQLLLYLFMDFSPLHTRAHTCAHMLLPVCDSVGIRLLQCCAVCLLTLCICPLLFLLSL